MQTLQDQVVTTTTHRSELLPVWIAAGASLMLCVAGELILRMGLDFSV